MNPFNKIARPYKARIAEAGVMKKRLAVCKECDKFIEDAYCKLCGCNMLNKAKYAGATCGEDKW